jgi:hypothetical protein
LERSANAQDDEPTLILRQSEDGDGDFIHPLLIFAPVAPSGGDGHRR